MVDAEELRREIAARHEWLMVPEYGRGFSLLSNEISVTDVDGRAHIGFLSDDGFHSRVLDRFEKGDEELHVDLMEPGGGLPSRFRLIPRPSAIELRVSVEAARLRKANEIAEIVRHSVAELKITRVDLNERSGRFAQILADIPGKHRIAILADITGKLSPEAIAAAGISWFDSLTRRKGKPILELWLICSRPASVRVSKLHANLNAQWKARISTAYIDTTDTESSRLVFRPERRISELWREKAPRLVIPAVVRSDVLAEKIVALAPDEIDINYSRQGETYRYLGLPFARSRVLFGREAGWFGIGRQSTPIASASWNSLTGLVRELAAHRRHDTDDKRHKLYRDAPEAWLESLLRRDIRQLDSNLVLSPIHAQFRTSNQKIDLLALRRDGRLVIIEVKTQPDRQVVLQAAEYWRRIELQRRRGLLDTLFAGREILDKPPIIYLTAPAWSIHRELDLFARALSPEIELWHFDLHEGWRECLKVVHRRTYHSEATYR